MKNNSIELSWRGYDQLEDIQSKPGQNYLCNEVKAHARKINICRVNKPRWFTILFVYNLIRALNSISIETKCLRTRNISMSCWPQYVLNNGDCHTIECRTIQGLLYIYFSELRFWWSGLLLWYKLRHTKLNWKAIGQVKNQIPFSTNKF